MIAKTMARSYNSKFSQYLVLKILIYIYMPIIFKANKNKIYKNLAVDINKNRVNYKQLELI